MIGKLRCLSGYHFWGPWKSMCYANISHYFRQCKRCGIMQGSEEG